jgi:Protein of unknown function (DUF3311)
LGEELVVTVRDPAPSPGQPEPEPVREAARRRVNTPAWNLLLILPLVGTLLPWIYNKTDPTLFDIPFFYWYQMVWIAVSVVVTLVVYRMTRGER